VLCVSSPGKSKVEIPDRGDIGRDCGGTFYFHFPQAVVSDV
jgi:hypothetical protein